MHDLQLSLQAMAPLLVPMLIGVVARRAHVISEELIPPANRMLFSVFCPCLLIGSIYGNQIAYAEISKVGIFMFIMTTALFIMLHLLMPKFEKEPARQGTIMQAILWPNFAIFTPPLVRQLLGEAYVSNISLLVAALVMPFIIYCSLALELHRQGKPSFIGIIKRLVKNPLLVFAAAALLLNALPVRIPAIIVDSIRNMGDVVAPLSFFILGASFRFQIAPANRRAVTFTACMRLVIVPACFFLIALLVGFRGYQLVYILALMIPPSAVSTFTMASEMGGDARLASENVVITSALSTFSIFLWVFVMRLTGIL